MPGEHRLVVRPLWPGHRLQQMIAAERAAGRGEEGTQTMLTLMPTAALLPQPYAIRPVTPTN